MNEKLKQLKNQQDDSLERIRQAYRSQLANALTQVGQFTQVCIQKFLSDFHRVTKIISNKIYLV